MPCIDLANTQKTAEQHIGECRERAKTLNVSVRRKGREMKQKRCPSVAICALSAAVLFLNSVFASSSVGAEQGIQDGTENHGYNCLFMGHSFFAPVANILPMHARRAGLHSHRQVVVAVGGIPGTAGELWKSTQPRVVGAKELIETGRVDVIGLTYHPDGGSDVADYGHWVELAVRHNPKTAFLIQAPWALKRNRNLAEFEEETQKWHDAVHHVIDGLRQAYPENRFFCIPQGQWMVELWRLFDAGKIPELTEFVARPGENRQNALFGDQIGHAGILPLRAGALLWLAAIYNVDLNTYAYDTGTEADLKGLAQRLVQEDPYCGFRRDGTGPSLRASFDTTRLLSTHQRFVDEAQEKWWHPRAFGRQSREMAMQAGPESLYQWYSSMGVQARAEVAKLDSILSATASLQVEARERGHTDVAAFLAILEDFDRLLLLQL
jgi:hypothetical protein